jgi:hypothetical protein
MNGKQKLKKIKTVEVVAPTNNVDLTTLKLSELRELYPNIKATSKKEFLEELTATKDV